MSQRGTIHGTVTRISAHLCNVAQGEHTMLVYDEMTSFRGVYSSHCKKALDVEGNSVMILSHYETRSSVVNALKEVELDVERHLSDESLLIKDASEMLSRSATVIDYLRYLATAELSAKKRGKKRLDVIIDMGCFYHLSRVGDIPAFEESLASKADSLTTICCYHKKDLEKLEPKAKEKVDSHHAKSFVIVENQ